ncbi:MAG TPA: hypothetical protein VE400_08565, partial [Mycobacterium sp.]|nr:hypothetical protein [Mycobacterium sp.]
MTAVGGVYTAMWNAYLNEELEYVSTPPLIDLNDQVFRNWNFNHVDPTGAEEGGPNNLYTAGDLAASMALNPYLKVFLASDYYDAVTPFLRTDLDIEDMPLADPRIRENLVARYCKSGHMVYLDNDSRAEMKKDLANFYESATTHPAGAMAARRRCCGRRPIAIPPTIQQDTLLTPARHRAASVLPVSA